MGQGEEFIKCVHTRAFLPVFSVQLIKACSHAGKIVNLWGDKHCFALLASPQHTAQMGEDVPGQGRALLLGDLSGRVAPALMRELPWAPDFVCTQGPFPTLQACSGPHAQLSCPADSSGHGWESLQH